MKRLYYATFERGFGEIVKKVLKKTDKNSKIKTLYDDAVLFFADEHFKFIDRCFFDAFIVIQNLHKVGVGALNQTAKFILEKKDLKITTKKETGTIKFTVSKENEKVLFDSKLKNALETLIKKKTQKSISYFAKEELVLLAKKDGENLFMKRIDTSCEFEGLRNKFAFKPEVAYLMCVMSEPQQNETVLEVNSKFGIIPYVRASAFVKANVIASSSDEDTKEKLKRVAKKLKINTFSVLGYDFLEDNFPIKFIDKIIADVSNISYGGIDELFDFYEKAFELRVKSLIVTSPKNYDINRFICDKYDIITEIFSEKFNVYSLKIKT